MCSHLSIFLKKIKFKNYFSKYDVHRNNNRVSHFITYYNFKKQKIMGTLWYQFIELPLLYS